MLPKKYRQSLLALMIASALESGALLDPNAQYTYMGYGANPEDRVSPEERIVLQKHPSAQIIFVDPVNGNNAWDGLAGVRQGATTNGPKLTLFAGMQTARNGFGDWVLVVKGSDPSTGANITQCQAKQGLSAQYPTLVSTYDQGSGPADDVTWRNTALYRTGYMNMASATAVGFYAHTNGATPAYFKWLVVENMDCTLPAPSTSNNVFFFGLGDGLLVENCKFHRRMLGVYVPSTQGLLSDPLTNMATRRCSFHKGLPQGFQDHSLVKFPIHRTNIYHACGYSGDLRSSPGQSPNEPSILEHNVYSYARSPRFSRCIISSGSSFGITARQGLSVHRSLFVNNAGHFICAEASTDYNHDYGKTDLYGPGLVCDVRDNVLSGLDYINGVDTSGGANGYIMAWSGTDQCESFLVRNNIVNNCITPGGVFYLGSRVTTQAYQDYFRLVTFDTTALMQTGAQLTRSSDSAAFSAFELRGVKIQLRGGFASLENNTIAIGDVLTQGGRTYVVTGVELDEVIVMNGSLPDFDGNIVRNSGPSIWATENLAGAGGLTASIVTTSRTNNVFDNATYATGSNVTYDSVAGIYLDPTRDAETYAVSLGYANSKAWLDYAVTRPDLDHCTAAVNWIRAGFNMAAL